jgi:hypothetical protein
LYYPKPTFYTLTGDSSGPAALLGTLVFLIFGIAGKKTHE